MILVELPAWELQGFSGTAAKSLHYAAADLQGMGPPVAVGALPSEARREPVVLQATLTAVWACPNYKAQTKFEPGDVREKV